LKPRVEKSPDVGAVGFTCAAMLDAMFITNVSKHANHASMTLSWFRVDLVVDLSLAVPFAFWPLLELGDFFAFPVWD
jgi:hypothetical protein